MAYRYKLRQDALTNSYTYKDVSLNKDQWYISEEKLYFPAIYKKYIIEEDINKNKKKIENIVDSTVISNFSFRDYNKILKSWTVSKYNKTISEKLAKMYILIEQNLVRNIGFKWDNIHEVYIKDIFLREIVYKGYNIELLKWEFDVIDKITKEVFKYSFFHFSELQNTLQDIINQKVVL